MHEKFRESWKAAAYIASGLHSDFPNEKFMVQQYFRDRITERVCTASDAGHVIEDFCKQFPLATVYYHGESSFGFIAQVRCHCQHEKSRGCCRDGHHHRAKILVTLAPVEEGADATG